MKLRLIKTKKYNCNSCKDEDPECKECCPHDDVDDYTCLICGKEMDTYDGSRIYED